MYGGKGMFFFGQRYDFFCLIRAALYNIMYVHIFLYKFFWIFRIHTKRYVNNITLHKENIDLVCF